jgi:hypothetical protein
MLLGVALIIPRYFLSPEILSAIGQAEAKRVFVFGVAILLYGFLDSFRHGNRFCSTCGHRFRFVRVGAPLVQIRRVDCEGTTGGSSSAMIAKPDPNQPIEPLLKCLGFKNEAMREDAANTLRRLTGKDFGTDADLWREWLSENWKPCKVSSNNDG